MSANPNIAAIILAAGRSARLGRPKQLIPFRGRTLLQLAIQTAVFSPCSSVSVVLGAFYPLVKKHTTIYDIAVVKNRKWMLGMGSSIKTGLRNVLANEREPYDGFLIMTCDQPLVNEGLLIDLYENFSDRDDIVASTYEGNSGVPAIFGRNHLDSLLKIEDRKGAKALLERVQTKTVPFQEGTVDVDTQKDVQRLERLTRWIPKIGKVR